jgi:hypothetical protein
MGDFMSRMRKDEEKLAKYEAEEAKRKMEAAISPRRQKFRDLLAAKREVIARAVSFEMACQVNKDDNTRGAEDAVNRACDALGTATRKLMRIQKRRV